MAVKHHKLKKDNRAKLVDNVRELVEQFESDDCVEALLEIVELYVSEANIKEWLNSQAALDD